MDEGNDGPSSGDALVRTFAIFFGSCLTLVGGLCTIGWVGMLIHSSGFFRDIADSIVFIVSVASLALGLMWLRVGRRERGRRGGGEAGE